MTKEEQLDWLCRLRSEIYVYMPKEWLIPMNNALDMVIKELEQEPCDDAISRQSVLNACEQSINILEAVDRIMDIPSVEQEPKTGHWIMTSDYLTTAYGSVNYVKCSCCGEDSLEEGDYCPNCGARMESEE